MYYRYRLFFIVLFCTLSASVRATHIVGGEMTYRQMGGNLYEVTLRVYRDCLTGQAQFDNPASIGIFDDQGNLLSATSAFITTQSPVPNVINSPCLTPPGNICYEVATYVFTTTLLPRQGGYQLVYQRCCRNFSVLNVFDVSSTGATYMATIPDPAIVTNNSSPEFNLLPPTFICEDAPFTFNHSATDADGDSIVYEICTPLRGADRIDPQPQPPNPPPYLPIQWQNPFTLSNPFGGVPLAIDPHTGILTATPLNSGQYVYGVCVKEYRNGVFIGMTSRDFQVNVVPCPMITVASIFSPTIVCGSLSAEFVNNSFNSATYLWDFGDPLQLNDTSSLKNPSWTYPDTGVYVATLIAYSGIDPLCNDTATGIVKVHPEFISNFTIDNQHCKPDFKFYDASFGTGGVSNYWHWNFGDGTLSNDTNPQHTYALPGQYEVELITSTDSACLDTMSQLVTVYQIPEAGFSTVLDTCLQSVQTSNNSLYGTQSVWYFENSWTGPSEAPQYTFTRSGVQLIRLVSISDAGCTDTAEALMIVPPLPEADFLFQVDECDSLVYFSNLSKNSLTYEWDFGDGAMSSDSSPQHTYTRSGRLPVRLISISPYSCRDMIIKELNFVSFKKAYFEAGLDSCSGLTMFSSVTPDAVTYDWDFGDGHTDSVQTPSHRYANDGEYRVLLTLNRESACRDSFSLATVHVSPLGEILYVPGAFTPNGDGLNDKFSISVHKPCEVYSLYIYNRWGQLVFEAEDAVNAHWDGTFNGSMAEEGAYVYLLKGEGKVKKGMAYLMR